MKALFIAFLLQLVSVRGQIPSSPFTTCEVSTPVLNGLDQTLGTPGYSPDEPINYQNDLSCTWVLVAAEPNEEIEVEFTNVLTEACCDYIEVRDGPTSDSPLIANIRKNLTLANYMSSTGSLYITFVSDGSITKTGFQFTYKAVAPNVNFTQQTASLQQQGSLASPSYPLHYPNNLYYLWDIAAPEDSYVFLFLPSFFIETCCDDLQIRDGQADDNDVALLAVLRGTSTRPKRFRSSGRFLSLRLRTNSAVTNKGFEAVFIARPESSRPSEPTAIPFDTDCHKNLTALAFNHSLLESPNYPSAHGHNLNCVWIITAAPGKRVRIWFTYVSTETCCDWIVIRNGSSHNSAKLGTVSGYNFEFHHFTSGSNIMRVEFNTDDSINARGFQAYYETYRPDDPEPECGGMLTASTTPQYIATPNWPGRYPNNTQCTWVIKSSPGTTIHVQMLGIITESFYDHVVVYDGDNTFARRLVFYHGKYYKVDDVMSSGSSVTVAFTSDGNGSFGGFRAAYTEIP